MKRKRYLSILLILAMLLSLPLCACAEASADDTVAAPGDQLKLIASKIDSLKQDDSTNTWYYTVVDLDHDGCLEFVAASLHPANRSTNLKVWTVSRDAATLSECRLNKDAEESFPDIMTDTTDTYHVKDTDTWYYMVYDNIVLSNTEVYTIKTAVNLKDGVISYVPYAIQKLELLNGVRTVSHTDVNGIAISANQYNASGADAFAGADRSNTAFEWLTADKVGNLDRLTESYEVFLGTREPTETFPVPKPDALKEAETPAPAVPSPAPAPSPAPVQPAQPTWLTITKNPTNENRRVGENAIFVACANAYESLTWTFVSPDGGEYSPASFLAGSGAYVSGEYSTTITVSNLESWMNGWGAYCTFYYKGQTARTSTAYMFVKENPPKPTPKPTPQPTYGSMSGRAYEGGAGYAIRLQNGVEVFVDSWNCNVEGQFYDGCSAIVYYTDYPSTATVYRADIYGNMGLIVPDEDQGGWAGSNYYDNEDQGGWAGSNYYDNEPGYEDDPLYDPVGDEHHRVTCPECGNHFSVGETGCPVCGWTP